VELKSVSWENEDGWLACCGEDSFLKLLKFQYDSKGSIAISANQNLPGHQGNVTLSLWNQRFKKLTTADDTGLIIVWSQNEKGWAEEMVNQRNKSQARAFKWNSNERNICIGYEDGGIIVGSQDGVRIWGKEAKNLSFSQCAWSPDSKIILLGLSTGDVVIYDDEGNYLLKMPYFVNENTGKKPKFTSMEWYNGKNGYFDSAANYLAIATDTGIIHLFKNFKDENPISIPTDRRNISVKWNYNGSLLAVSGTAADGASAIDFYNQDKLVHSFPLQTKAAISGLSWNYSSNALAFTSQNSLFFASIVVDYPCCFVGNNLVYTMSSDESEDLMLVFMSTATSERTIKYLRNVVCMSGYGDLVAIVHADASSG
jgi:WD repeat-containing protein 35